MSAPGASAQSQFEALLGDFHPPGVTARARDEGASGDVDAVAGAIEGAFFGIDSIAVSLEAADHPPIHKAAALARQVIEQILEKKTDEASLYNLNIPLAACEGAAQVKILPMGVERYGEHYLKRKDPKGRTYYWATNEPPPQPGEHETDLTALAEGFITLTPLQYNMTHSPRLQAMADWRLSLAAES